MSGEVWFKTFEACFKGLDRAATVSLLETIVKSERKEGMRDAAKIAASHCIEDPELDAVARSIAREILDAGENL